MPDLRTHLRSHDLNALAADLASRGTLDLADEMRRLDPIDRVVAFRMLDRERALTVFEAFAPHHQQEVVDELRGDDFARLMEDLQPDDRARLLGELPAKVSSRVLAGLSEEQRTKTAALLGYPAESAGRMMSTEYVSLRESMTLTDALSKIRRQGMDAETVYVLPVTDDERHLRGIVSLRQLVLGGDDTIVGEAMSSEIRYVAVDDDQEVAARILHDADQLALPVLDTEARLVGMITIDDAMDVIEAEATEDLALSAASAPLTRSYLSSSVWGLARSRAVWLLVLIVAATLTVNVLKFFEDVLESAVTLALFIPLLTSSGGNCGAQASTMVIRAMSLDEVRFVDLPRVVWREARVGFSLGAMLAAVGFIPAAWFFDLDLALVIAITLVTICAWATFAGSMLPLLAQRFGADPAVVSAPLVTTLVDATGLIIYFLVAKAVLGL